MITFLCATDFSSSAENAIYYANELAQILNARIILFHTIQAPTPSYPIYGSIIPHEQLEIELEERKEFLDKLEVIKTRLHYNNPYNNVIYETHVRHGLAKDIIPAVIKQEQVDLVIIGSETANSLKDIFVGTLAADIIAKSSCPVLIIPQSATFKPLRKLVFASDLRNAPFTDLGLPLRLAELFNAQLMLLHILTADIPEAREIAFDELSKFYSSVPYRVVSLHVELSPYIEEGISDFIRENHADMLVIGYHPNELWQHLFPVQPIKDLVYHTYLPILILHQTEN